ncbi:hypothetical protein [Adhaeribacter terreus]|uniref:Uncharacterized protein n=1 Tax=Adhaeribacter terreus TaxID=529703 RepID=A0ABW0EA30_9BACT
MRNTATPKHKGQGEDTKLFHFLQAVPFLNFSEKGLQNIAKRFSITPEQLKAAIAEFMKGGKRYA